MRTDEQLQTDIEAGRDGAAAIRAADAGMAATGQPDACAGQAAEVRVAGSVATLGDKVDSVAEGPVVDESGGETVKGAA